MAITKTDVQRRPAAPVDTLPLRRFAAIALTNKHLPGRMNIAS